MTALDHFFCGNDNTLSLLEQILILAVDLPFLNIMVLTKPPPVYLQNALSTIMVFYTVLLLTKELPSQPERCDSGLTIMQCTGLSKFPNILKQLP